MNEEKKRKKKERRKKRKEKKSMPERKSMHKFSIKLYTIKTTNVSSIIFIYNTPPTLKIMLQCFLHFSFRKHYCNHLKFIKHPNSNLL